MAVTTFEYADGEYDLTITVGTATMAQGIERTRLALQASEERRAALTGGEEVEPSLPYINEWSIRLFNIPAIIAATREFKNAKDAVTKLRRPITAEKVFDDPGEAQEPSAE